MTLPALDPRAWKALEMYRGFSTDLSSHVGCGTPMQLPLVNEGRPLLLSWAALALQVEALCLPFTFVPLWIDRGLRHSFVAVAEASPAISVAANRVWQSSFSPPGLQGLGLACHPAALFSWLADGMCVFQGLGWRWWKVACNAEHITSSGIQA